MGVMLRRSRADLAQREASADNSVQNDEELARQHDGGCVVGSQDYRQHALPRTTPRISRSSIRDWNQGTRCRCHGDSDGRSVAPMPVFSGIGALLGDGVIMKTQMQQKPATGPTQKPATPSYKPATTGQPCTGGSPPKTGPCSPKPGQPGQPSQPPKK